MSLLIDGYNLLHGTDLFGRGRNSGTLEASREALLSFVLAAVEAAELAHTIIVFDAKEAPPGLPRVVSRKGLTIRFATGYADADELLIELIQADHAPKNLTVVSSDHQVQRAARRRKARFVDSHQWYFDMKQRLARPGRQAADAKPEGPLSPAEVAAFLRELGPLDEPLLPGLAPAAERSPPASVAEPPSAREPGKIAATPLKPRGRRRGAASLPDDKALDLANPFPPGYAEDLLDEANP